MSLIDLRDVCVKWSILTFISCDSNHQDGNQGTGEINTYAELFLMLH